MAAPPEMTGLGVGVEIEPSLTSEAVWQVLLLKIQKPNLFLPVQDVFVRPSDDGAGTYREMTMTSTGARVTENIYAAPFEVRFVVVNDENEHVNIITTDAAGVRHLEFYKRVAASKERVPWAAPKAVALGGINAVLEMARKGVPAGV